MLNTFIKKEIKMVIDHIEYIIKEIIANITGNYQTTKALGKQAVNVLDRKTQIVC
jgi:hypothetical protein